MASALSEDEFHRMQLQLLELRTVNYQLEDKCKRQERELVSLKGQFETSERDLLKANKVINKSKKAKDVELLIQENDSIQNKLHSQEEEFRLQNETIMQELGELVKANERLEKENQSLKESGGSSAELSSGVKDDARRLQAENSALQKNLIACQEKYEEELSSLNQTITDLESQCFKLSGQRGTPVGAGSEGRTVEGDSDPENISEPCSPNTLTDTHEAPDQDITDGSVLLSDRSQSFRTSPDKLHTPNTSPLISSEKNSSSHQKAEHSKKIITELQLSLDTEKEEKRILKDQLLSIENQYKDQVKCLQSELDKLTEKLKKKQESLVQLQEEKELIYTELRCTLNKRIEEVQSSKEAEVSQLKYRSDKLQQDLSQCNQVLQDYEQKSNVRIHHLETLVNSLESRVRESNLDSYDQLEEQNSWYQQQYQSLGQQLTDAKRANNDLEKKFKESQVTHRKGFEELRASQREADELKHALQDTQKVAEKRKSLLDELAIKYQEESDQHREQVRGMEDGHRAELDLLNDQLEELRMRSLELDDVKEELEALRAQYHSVDNTKGWLQRRLNETEETLNQTRQEHGESMSTAEEDHRKEMDSLRENHSFDVKNLEDRIVNVRKETESKEESIVKLQQDIKDGLGDKKIHEKKGATIIKDLKRQLHQERKRADKMQERLQDFLADSKSRQSVEELFRPCDPNDRYKGDASSISSWNASILSRENTLQSPEEETAGVSLVDENADLLKRLTNVQQEKWTLEEKVSHLESSNACMAEDLLQKTAVIQHYVMESRTEGAAQSPSSDKISLKRMVDIIKDRGDDNLREMNKKLQNMLEETLTKNMHLQKDMETFSQEIVRLSKQNVPTAAAAAETPSVQQAN